MGDTKTDVYQAEQMNPLSEGFFKSMMGEAAGWKEGMMEQFQNLKTPEDMFNYYTQNVAPFMQDKILGPVGQAYQPWAEQASEAGIQAGAQTAAAGGTFYTGATRGDLQKQAMLPYLQVGAQMGQLGAQLAGQAYGTTAGAFQGYGQQTLGAAGLMGAGYGQTMGLAGQQAAPYWSEPTVVQTPGFWDTLLGGAAGMVTGGIAGGIGAGLGGAIGSAIMGDQKPPPQPSYMYPSWMYQGYGDPNLG